MHRLVQRMVRTNMMDRAVVVHHAMMRHDMMHRGVVRHPVVVGRRRGRRRDEGRGGQKERERREQGVALGHDGTPGESRRCGGQVDSRGEETTLIG